MSFENIGVFVLTLCINNVQHFPKDSLPIALFLNVFTFTILACYSAMTIFICGEQHEFNGEVARRATRFSKMLFNPKIYAALNYENLRTVRQLCYPGMCKKNCSYILTRNGITIAIILIQVWITSQKLLVE